MNFYTITEFDYLPLIDPDDLDTILYDNDSIRTSAERAAIQLARTYLESKYDLDKIFVTGRVYQPGYTFDPGELAYFEPDAHDPGQTYASQNLVMATVGNDTRMYKAKQAVPLGILIEEAAYWQMAGPLNPYWICNGTTGLSPSDGPGLWTNRDPRHAYLVQVIIDIALFNISSRLNGPQIPEIRIKRYDAAMAWLKDLAAGKITDPDLPIIGSTESQTGTFRASYRPRRNYDW